MNESIKLLYEEHEIILYAVDAARRANSFPENDNLMYEDTVRQLISFFRSYADKYHHYKEEKILFPEMSKRNELLMDGAIKEMLENHEDFREMIRGIEQFLDEKNYSGARQQLEKYTEALLNHIAVENDEVFLMAESIFTEEELKKISHRFIKSAAKVS